MRDRALLGTLAYTFARIAAVVNLRTKDELTLSEAERIRAATFELYVLGR